MTLSPEIETWIAEDSLPAVDNLSYYGQIWETAMAFKSNTYLLVRAYRSGINMFAEGRAFEENWSVATRQGWLDAEQNAFQKELDV